MAAITIRPKGRAEWLAHRQTGIGSSEAASVLGLNPYETPYRLWRRKKGIDPPQETTFAMRAGNYLEDAVSRFWADETGREIIRSSAADTLYVDAERKWLRATPDRTYRLPGLPRNSANKGILECKTTQRAVGPDDIPRYWFCQLQYQLGVTGLRNGSLAWLTAGRDFGHADVAFVPDFYGWMAEEVTRFWTDHILGDREPGPLDAADVLAKYSRHVDGKAIEADENTMESYSELKTVRAEMSALEKRKEELEGRLKLGFGDAEMLAYHGQTLATWKAARDSDVFDTKRFKSDHPELAAQYTATKPGSRRFLVK